jgi:hypothetical protein
MTEQPTFINNRFKQSFEQFSCFDDSIEAEIDGFDIVARLEFDGFTTLDEDNFHNPNQNNCGEEEQKKLLAARRAWERDEWHYANIVLSVARQGVMLDERAASLGGVEMNYPTSDNSYLTEAANELIDDALGRGQEVLKELISSINQKDLEEINTK